MELDWIWKFALLVVAGMILLRIAGRKSISQMSVATTVIMISIGTTIVQPIANHETWKAIGSAAIFIAVLIVVEYLQVKWNRFEQWMSGSAKIVIQDGMVVPDSLRKIRMTADQLELRLRNAGISSIGDVQRATIEPNGQLGYELMRHAKPVTIGELERMLGLMPPGVPASPSGNLFEEIQRKGHDHSIDPKLQ
jgi:Predicted membrane protein